LAGLALGRALRDVLLAAARPPRCSREKVSMTSDLLFVRPLRLACLALVGLGLAFAPAAALAQATPPKPATTTTAPKAEPAKPAATKAAATKAAAKDDDEDDSPSSAAQKKACDAKWKVEKEKSKASGWKAYFTFMSKCM
jgi:hypothetical protein